MEPRAPRPEMSIVVPAFNEVQSLPTLLRELRAAIAATGRTHELIVVDDGNTDGTAAWLRAERARDRKNWKRIFTH